MIIVFSTFCWPTVSEIPSLQSLSIYVASSLLTWFNWNFVSILPSKKRPRQFLWIFWSILKSKETRSAEKDYCRTFHNSQPTMNLCISWRMEILLPQCTSLCFMRCSCLLIKISTCKPIYAKYRAWFSSAPCPSPSSSSLSQLASWKRSKKQKAKTH